MKTLVVEMATRNQMSKRLTLVVNDDTTIPEVCTFALQYANPPLFPTSQRLAQAIIHRFNEVPDGRRETLGIA